MKENPEQRLVGTVDVHGAGNPMLGSKLVAPTVSNVCGIGVCGELKREVDIRPTIVQTFGGRANQCRTSHLQIRPGRRDQSAAKIRTLLDGEQHCPSGRESGPSMPRCFMIAWTVASRQTGDPQAVP